VRSAAFAAACAGTAHPRLLCSGRFTLELHQSFLRMIGKSNEFKVLYKNIARMYFLPRPSHTAGEVSRSAFVISLEEPIRHGQQRYAHLIAQLEAKREDVTIPVNLSKVCDSVVLPACALSAIPCCCYRRKTEKSCSLALRNRTPPLCRSWCALFSLVCLLVRL
jgi:hypothetical protein